MRLDEVPLNDLLALRKMTSADGERAIANWQLSSEDAEKARELVGKDVPPAESAFVTQQQEWSDKRLWRAAAYVLGASLRQIATIEDVAHTSVNDSLRRVLGEGRQHERLAKRIPFEHLSAYLRAFNSNLETLRPLPVKEVAKWLQSQTDLD